MGNLTELYVKEKNLLQLPMFYFGKGRPTRTVVEWADNKGNYKLECACKYGVPGSSEQDVYAACMRIWVKSGMPKELTLNYSGICKELDLDPVGSTSRIKKSLEKLAQARYEFTQCFLLKLEDGSEKITTHFSLFESADLFKSQKGKSNKDSKSVLFFPERIRNNLERKYYQYLDLYWYKRFPEGLARRLYEYLEKRRYHKIDNVFSISEESICRWLPIRDKHTTNRRKRLEKISGSLIKVGYLKEYKFDKNRCICHFTYAKSQNLERYVSEKIENTESNLLEVIKWIDNIPYFHKNRKKEILQLSNVISLYPVVKSKYEEMASQGKQPKAGWVYKAFTDNWEFPEHQKKEERKKATEKMEKNIENCKSRTLKFLSSENTNNLLYKGQRFVIMDDYGLCLLDVNVLESWENINLKEFETTS